MIERTHSPRPIRLWLETHDSGLITNLPAGLLPKPRCPKTVSIERAMEQMRTRFLDLNSPHVHANVSLVEI